MSLISLNFIILHFICPIFPISNPNATFNLLNRLVYRITGLIVLVILVCIDVKTFGVKNAIKRYNNNTFVHSYLRGDLLKIFRCGAFKHHRNFIENLGSKNFCTHQFSFYFYCKILSLLRFKLSRFLIFFKLSL